MPLENEKIEVAEEKETEMPNVEELLKILLDVNLEQNRIRPGSDTKKRLLEIMLSRWNVTITRIGWQKMSFH